MKILTIYAGQGYMDGAIESGERVANEILYVLYANTDKAQSIKIDYEKTFYHQREFINAVEANQAKQLVKANFYQSLAKLAFKWLPLIGAGSLLLIKFKYNLSTSGLIKLTKNFSL